MQTQLFFAVLRGGSLADRNHFGIIFHVVADADTEKYYFRIISAMNLDKRYIVSPHGQTGNHTFTQMRHPTPFRRTTRSRATIACQYSVGACGRCDTVLSSRSLRKCRYPPSAYPCLTMGKVLCLRLELFSLQSSKVLRHALPL